MIIAGSPDKQPNSNAELPPEVAQGFRREFGRKGLSAVAVENDVTGYPVNVDAEGNHVITVESSVGPVRELKEGEIGYSAKNISEAGPAVLTREDK